MVKLPNAVGLVLCEQIVIEENTHNVTLVNAFNRLRCRAFPSLPQRFVMYTMLTDGLGNATMSVKLARLDTLEEIYEHDWPMGFDDPMRNVRLVRLRGIVSRFPHLPGSSFCRWRMPGPDHVSCPCVGVTQRCLSRIAGRIRNV
jgi:hypothetical protein